MTVGPIGSLLRLFSAEISPEEMELFIAAKRPLELSLQKGHWLFLPGRVSGSFAVVQLLSKVVARDFQRRISGDSTRLPRFEQIDPVWSFALVLGVPRVI